MQLEACLNGVYLISYSIEDTAPLKLLWLLVSLSCLQLMLQTFLKFGDWIVIVYCDYYVRVAEGNWSIN